MIRGLPLYAHYTGKDIITKPNSLIGPPSRFLLMIFDNPPLNFDASFVNMILRPFGKCLQVTLFLWSSSYTHFPIIRSSHFKPRHFKYL